MCVDIQDIQGILYTHWVQAQSIQAGESGTQS